VGEMTWPIDGSVDLEIRGSIYEIKPEKYLKGYRYVNAFDQVQGYVESAGSGYQRGSAFNAGLHNGRVIDIQARTPFADYTVSFFYDTNKDIRTGNAPRSGLIFYRATKHSVQIKIQPILIPLPIPGGNRSKRDGYAF
jgi:hypothetical protein